MYKFKACILFFCLCMGSCADKKVSAPYDADKTVSILTDMILIEASLSGVQTDKRDSLKDTLTLLMLDHYDMDEQDLYQLSRYLEQNPDSSLEYHDKARNRIDEIQRTVN